MSALPTPRPMTIEEFERLDLPDDKDYELFEGELIEMSWPDWRPHRYHSCLTSGGQ